MTPSQKTLWDKIESFRLDLPQADFSFSIRLARENKWNTVYTFRVIKEYKRFIFLCCISEKNVTPSDAVDQAWHLHLTHTKSYWTDFCENTLHKQIHHNPTQGGKSEAEKFDDYYTATLLLYRETFGVNPPGDIWPVNQIRFSDIEFQRVNTKKYFLIRKMPVFRTLIILLVPTVSFLFIQASPKNAFPAFFAVSIVITIVIAIINAIKGGGSNKNNNTTSGCTMAGCSTSSNHHHGDSGCSSGCSGCSSSGCSGCGGGD